MNLHHADPKCDLDHAANAARVETAPRNIFGFGGRNDTLIARRFAV